MSDPTDKSLEIARGIVGVCHCDDMYRRRQLDDPNCDWCQHGEDIANALDRQARLVEALKAECEAAKRLIQNERDAADPDAEGPEVNEYNDSHTGYDTARAARIKLEMEMET